MEAGNTLILWPPDSTHTPRSPASASVSLHRRRQLRSPLSIVALSAEKIDAKAAGKPATEFSYTQVPRETTGPPRLKFYYPLKERPRPLSSEEGDGGVLSRSLEACVRVNTHVGLRFLLRSGAVHRWALPPRATPPHASHPCFTSALTVTL